MAQVKMLLLENGPSTVISMTNDSSKYVVLTKCQKGQSCLDETSVFAKKQTLTLTINPPPPLLGEVSD